MTNQNHEPTTINPASNATVLERIAQSILVAHAWVAGPAMSDRERIQRELVKAEATGNTGAGIAG